MPIRANVGLRYEDTEVSSYTIGNPVIGFNWVSPLELSKIYASEEAADTLTGEYNHLLPNFDFSVDVIEDLVARVSYSKTIARSNIDAMYL